MRKILLPQMAGALLFCSWLGSCKPELRIKNFEKENKDSVYHITLEKESDNGLVLNIHNSNLEAAEFYITPEDINLYSDSTIILQLVHDSMSAREKCLSLWKFMSEWTYHGRPLSKQDRAINDPAILINAFQAGICDDRNAALANLAGMSGTPSRVYGLKGHVVAELFYDGSWHMFDADKNLYYETPDGEVAGVDYLAKNPAVMDKKNEVLKYFMERWRNKRSRTAIVSTENNWVTSSYDIGKSEYSSAIKLRAYDRLLMRTEPAGAIEKFIALKLMRRSGPLSRGYGSWLSKVSLGTTSEADGDTIIIKQDLPYPMYSVTVASSGSHDLYYSCDGQHWFFRGSMYPGSTELAFVPHNGTHAAFSFLYYLKLVNKQPGTGNGKGHCTIESRFIFSERILGSDPDRSFRVVPLNDQAGKMEVNLHFE